MRRARDGETFSSYFYHFIELLCFPMKWSESTISSTPQERSTLRKVRRVKTPQREPRTRAAFFPRFTLLFLAELKELREMPEKLPKLAESMWLRIWRPGIVTESVPPARILHELVKALILESRPKRSTRIWAYFRRGFGRFLPEMLFALFNRTATGSWPSFCKTTSNRHYFIFNGLLYLARTSRHRASSTGCSTSSPRRPSTAGVTVTSNLLLIVRSLFRDSIDK